MKWTICIFLLGILFLSCKKDDPIPPAEEAELIDQKSDSSYNDQGNLSPQTKVLLMQEFTGVYCYTCPLAHGITADVISAYPNRVVAMNIHSHFFSIYGDPNVMGNLYDFRTEDGDTIVSMLGGVLSVPSAAFDMTKMTGEPDITSNSRPNWMGYVSTQMNLTPDVNIEIVSRFTPSSRNLKIVAKYHILNDQSEPLYYSLGLVENNIVDKQFVDTVVVDDYHHMHILRDMITDPKGESLDAAPNKGEVFVKVYNYTLPTDWNENEVDIVTYVHERTSKWNVHQAAMVKAQ